MFLGIGLALVTIVRVLRWQSSRIVEVLDSAPVQPRARLDLLHTLVAGASSKGRPWFVAVLNPHTVSSTW